MSSTDVVDPSLVARVAALALGLAFARREDAETLRELADLAGGEEAALRAARRQLAGLEVVDDEVRERADVLLYAAASHLDRLLVVEGDAVDVCGSVAAEPPGPDDRAGWRSRAGR